jgi:radical SAM protein with 4Fe4S-binding SPASM domain
MPLERFKMIINECQGKTFQVALGGRGDPDMHPDIVEILRYAREHDVVPNFTTSGFGLDARLLPAIKEYCGAVAVSWYRNQYTERAFEMFLAAGIRTNIHYCISNNTMDEAIDMMQHKKYPQEINRIIFLLHKPVGLGTMDNVLDVHDQRVKTFFSMFDEKENADKAGFDSCSVPAILNFTDNIHPACIEPCEAGRFSAYISPDFKLVPCSFEKDPNYAVSLENSSISEAWNSTVFESFRNRQSGKCPDCPRYDSCFAGCPIVPEVTLCNSAYRDLG